MLDPDPPAVVRCRAAVQANVAAGVDRVVAEPGAVQDRGGPVDRPALDETGRVHQAGGPRVEVAVRLDPEPLAPGQHLADVVTRLLDRQLAAGQPADLAVLLVGAERRVDPAQPVEHRLEDLAAGALVADVDDNRHAHDLLDAANARHSGRGGHAARAFRIADWSDWTNAALASVAPETSCMFALCACSASLRRMGIACWLITTDREV